MGIVAHLGGQNLGKGGIIRKMTGITWEKAGIGRRRRGAAHAHLWK